MAKISGGHLVARALKQEGVEAIFTLCGGHIIDIYDGCIDEGIKIIDIRHEQTAAHAADGWTRVTGVPGVAVVTAGPGTTDTVTGIANAFRAQSPMLLIGGQAARIQYHQGGLQELDHVSIMKPITKFASAVLDTERIPELIGMAFREAYNGRPGPSFLEIPRDILDAQVDEEAVTFPTQYRSRGRVHGDPKLIQKAADWLSGAERPAVLAGSQVWHCRAPAQLLEFSERAAVPIYLNGAARGCLPRDWPFYMNYSRRNALSQADVVLVIGTPFDFRLGYGSRIAQGAKVIQVDLDYGELGHNRDVDIGIVGDAGAVLEQLTAAITPTGKNKEWLKQLRQVEVKQYEAAKPLLYSDAVPIHPLRVAREINDFLTEDTMFIGDGGDVVTISARAIQPRQPGHWMDPGPLGTLGVGTPFAIATKVARPDKEVVILFGDGAFGCTGFDYDTLIRFKLPVIGVVGNNAAWNQIRFGQIQKYGPERGDVANLLAPTRYDRIVEAMGGYGEHVTEPQQIRPAMERARDSGKPACINVMIDPDVFSSGTRNQTMYK
ncbi:MAG: thiamine pyrophosphate-binding protein [Candidatus Poribacteria bacterium]|nr:thiamine pyrophosphate-binding protein [Candidatus Poribacteria bacterium]